MSDDLLLTKAAARKYGPRGGAKRASGVRQWYVDGQHLTLQEIADRRGGNAGSAYKRIRKLRSRGLPITWENLTR